MLPAFQAPDEQSHFTYVQTLGERFALPGDAGRPFFSTQLSAGHRGRQLRPGRGAEAGQAGVERPGSRTLGRATQATAPRDDGGGPGPASNYPPTAYAWQALGYLAASGGTVFDELLGARLMSALWVPITVLATWLLAGEIFGRRRVLQTAAAAVPALVPMVAFISASVSPDGMMYAIWTLALWLGRALRQTRRPAARRGRVLRARRPRLHGQGDELRAARPGGGARACSASRARRPSGLRSVLRLAAAVVIPLALTLGVWVLAASLDRTGRRRSPSSPTPPSGDELARAGLVPLAVLPAAPAVPERLPDPARRLPAAAGLDHAGVGRVRLAGDQVRRRGSTACSAC